MISSKESFIMPPLAHLCAAFASKMRRLWTTFFFLHCEFAMKGWSLLFRIFNLDFCLPSKIDIWMLVMGSMAKLFVQRGTSCGDVLCSLMWRIWIWKERNSRDFYDKYDSFDFFFGIWFNTQLLGGVPSTPNT